MLHEAGETHHRVYRIVDGADDDWASWYAWWLINLSELPDLLGAKPVRSELIYLLVSLDKQYSAARGQDEPWESYYVRAAAWRQAALFLAGAAQMITIPARASPDRLGVLVVPAVGAVEPWGEQAARGRRCEQMSCHPGSGKKAG